MPTRKNAYTLTDAQDRMIGHFCLKDPGCTHCEAGVPFMPPPDERLDWFSGPLLAAVSLKLYADIATAQATLLAIVRELAGRDHA